MVMWLRFVHEASYSVTVLISVPPALSGGSYKSPLKQCNWIRVIIRTRIRTKGASKLHP